MGDFQVRADAVDVEQIMRQIRARIREKRGADYTEAEIQELATVKLEKFLDPRGVRSNLVEEFRRNRVISPEPKKLDPGEIDIYASHRGALRTLRRLLNPFMKMLFNPTPLIHAVNTVAMEQNALNLDLHRRFRQREEMDPLYYEVIHNLVVELTRLSIENANLKMRVESLSSRMDFDERRGRALESVVQYKPAPQPGGQPPRPGPERQDRPERPERPERSDRPEKTDRPEGDRANAGAAAADPQRAGLEPRDQGERGDRRRRRRRRRRPGQNMASGQGQGGSVQGAGSNVQGPSSSQSPDVHESSAERPIAHPPIADSPSADSRSDHPITRSPDSQMSNGESDE